MKVPIDVRLDSFKLTLTLDVDATLGQVNGKRVELRHLPEDFGMRRQPLTQVVFSVHKNKLSRFGNELAELLNRYAEEMVE